MAQFPFSLSRKTQEWGPRTNVPADPYHKGLDFGVAAGSAVACAAAGVVTIVDHHSGYNFFKQVDHGVDSQGRRWWTRYHMLGSTEGPAEGATVAEGQMIGISGPKYGVSTGPHHHFEIHTDDTSLHKPNFATSVNPEIYINYLPQGDDMYDAAAKAELYDQIANDARPLRLYTVGNGIHAMGPGGKSEVISTRAYVDLLIAMRLAGPATPAWNDAQFQWAKSISSRLNPDPQVNAALRSVLDLDPQEAEELARGLEDTSNVAVLSRAQVAELVEAAATGDDAKVEELSFVTVLN